MKLKRLLLLLAVVLAPSLAPGAERYSNQCRIDAGAISNGCTVDVFLAGTTNSASIFSDDGLLSAKSNPFTADADGRYFFYAADGDYDVKTSGGTPAVVTTTTGDISLGGATGGVSSVFGRTGAVVAASADYTASQVTSAASLAANNDWGAFYQELDQITTPASPASGSIRLFMDSADGLLKIRKSTGTVVQLESGATVPGTVTSIAMTVPSILSVAGSPVTTSGTLAVTLATQLANIVLAGPTSGGAATPAFRALGNADIPALNTLASGLTISRCVETDGAGLLTVAAAACGSGSGSVTSVAMTVPSILTLTGSPITASGTLAVGLATQLQNLFLASPDGAGGAPTFRAIVGADIPSLPTTKLTGTVTDAQVPNTITLDNITQITTRAIGSTTGDLAASRVDDGGVASTRPLFSGGGAVAAFRAIVKADLPATDVHTDQANSYTAGSKQLFQASATTAGLRIGCSALPSSPTAGDLVCDSAASNALKFHNGTSFATIGSHNMLSATHPDTTAATVVRGDLVTGQTVTPEWTRLALGAANRYPKSDGTDVVYSTLAAAGIGTCTAQFVRANNADAAPTCEAIASADLPLASAVTWTGFHSFQSGELRPPEKTFASAPTCNAGNIGKVFIITDAPSSAQCSGGGSSPSLCRCDGTSSYEPLGGGAASGGGWTDGGTNIALGTVTDTVSIGNASGTGKLTVESTAITQATYYGRGIASQSANLLTLTNNLDVVQLSVSIAGKASAQSFATLASVSAGIVKNDGSGNFTFGGTIAKTEAVATFVHTDQSNTYTAGSKQIFTGSATVAGLNLVPLGLDPSAPVAGDLWVVGSTLRFRGSSTTLTTETTVNKNAASGYAGLTGATKLALAQGQEVWALADLTDATATTGTGTLVVLQGSPTLTGTPVIGDGAGNDKLSFVEEATDPTCSAGDYHVWANSAGLLKKCDNGQISPFAGGPGASPPKQFIAAACQGTTASSAFNLTAASTPAAGCTTGSNTTYGALLFDFAADEFVQDKFQLPSVIPGSINLDIRWKSALASGAVAARWCIQTSFVADGETGDPAWNTAQCVNDTNKATLQQWNDAAIPALTLTGGAANEEMFFRFYRDPDNAGDTMNSDDAHLISLRFTLN